MNRSQALVILLGSQSIALMSLLVWMILFSILFNTGHLWQSENIVFILYPLLPLSLSGYAWVMFKLKIYRRAVIASAIPAAIAFCLMTYYYIVGLTL